MEEEEQEQAEESPVVQFVKPPEPEEEQGDDMSDLFEVDREELTDTKDVVAVDIEDTGRVRWRGLISKSRKRK